MKIVNYIKAFAVIFSFTAAAALFSSCEKEEDEFNNKVVVHQVTLHNKTTTTDVITNARPGTILRLDGAGFSTTKAIYVNGVKVSVNPGYVTENHIIMSIPATVPFGSEVTDVAARNTIRIVTAHDDYSHPFQIQGPVPVVSGVSHSLPRVGEKLEIYGTNLRDLHTITFPGDITLTEGQFQVNDTYTTITCTVPAGATTTPGGIHVAGANGEAYSYNYMNRTECIFIKNFTADPNIAPYGQKAYNWGSNITATQSALLPQGGNDHKNPDAYRQVATTVSDVPVEKNVGGFNFRTAVGLTSVLQTSNDTVTAETLCSNLALQFDMYIPVPWESGLIRIDFKGGNSSWRYNYAPWAVPGGERSPVVMTGWRTVTVPLNAISALSGKTFQNFIDETQGVDGVFSFINGTYTGPGGTAYAPNPIPGFQLSFGNFRIVPYVKKK